MDPKTIGNTIAYLRKKSGMTQIDLAAALGISNKTISKWESGQGYPDITFFPLIASLFGVSIDYLMLGEKKGIAIAGSIIADIVKDIEGYPTPGMMTYLYDITPAVGGCVPNTAISLARIDKSIPIEALGKVGTDENGRYIISVLQKNGVGTKGISYSEKSPTSFCDVMNVASGERTFFHKKGANAEFSPSDIDLDNLNCNMLHIGYIFLLDIFDSHDEEFGTVMARFLKGVQNSGIKTSIDVVSDSHGDYKKTIIPALKYTNYAIMNEIEACRVLGVSPRNDDGKINKTACISAMRKMVEYGVSDKVIVHAKEISFILDSKSGEITSVPSLKIPKEEIKGSVGAGDAFCAACLYALYNNFSDKRILEFASAAAACNLFSKNSIDGMRSKAEILKIEEKYERLEG